MQEQELIDEGDYSLLVSMARARGELGFIVKWAVDQGLEVDWDWYSGWDWSPAKWNVHSRFEYETDTCCRNSAGELVLPRGVIRDDVSALQLGAACASGDTHRVGELLEPGVDVNQLDKFGETALTYAARAGHVDVVRQLIAAGADVNEPNSLCRTPVCFAVSANNLPLARVLLAAGADPDHIQKYSTPRETLLFESVQQGAAAMAELLLVYGANVNHWTGWRTPLYDAVNSWNFSMSVIEVLLQHGADPNVFCHTDTTRTDGSQETVLHFAVSTVKLPLVTLLLQYGGDPNVWSHTLSSAFRSHLMDYNDDRQWAAIAIIKRLIPLSTSFDIDVFDDDADIWVVESCLLQTLMLELQRHPGDLELTRFLLQHGVTARFEDLFDVILRASPPSDSECFSEDFVQLLRLADIDFGGVLRPRPDLRQSTHRSFLAMVRRHLSTPLSLHDVTIMRIRRSLGVPQLWRAIRPLPLPKPLKVSLKLPTSKDACGAVCTYRS